MLRHPGYTLGITWFVVGCGGSDPTAPQLLGPENPAEQALLAQQQFEAVGELDYTPLASVPSTGSAQFRGIMEGRVSDLTVLEGTFFANLGLEVDFASNDVAQTAIAESFNFAEGVKASGRLLNSERSFDRSGDPDVDHTLTVGLDGQLFFENQDPLELNLQLEGDFLGPNAEFVGGLVFGRASFGSEVGSVTGRFTAEQ